MIRCIKQRIRTDGVATGTGTETVVTRTVTGACDKWFCQRHLKEGEREGLGGGEEGGGFWLILMCPTGPARVARFSVSFLPRNRLFGRPMANFRDDRDRARDRDRDRVRNRTEILARIRGMYEMCTRSS